MSFASLRESIACMNAMTYLNAGWIGPSPARVIERMREAATRESEAGPAGPDGRAFAAEIAAEAQNEAALLFNVAPADVLLTHGTTEGVIIVLHGLAWKPGDVLLTTDLEHRESRGPLGCSRSAESRSGPVVIPPDAPADQCMEAFRAALSPSVKVLALSHIMFTTGLRIPAEEIVAVAHEAGALVLLDAAQTAGHVALDLTAMDVDFYASSGQKWLLGPTGSGALYVRPDRRELLTPLFTRPGLNRRQGLGMYALASQGVAERAGYAEAVRINRELGPEKVEEHTNRLAAMLRAELSEVEGVRLNGPTDPRTACAITAISVEGWEAPQFVEALWQKHRVVARHVAYPAGVRLCHRSLQRRNRRRARRRSDSSRSRGVGSERGVEWVWK